MPRSINTRCTSIHLTTAPLPFKLQVDAQLAAYVSIYLLSDANCTRGASYKSGYCTHPLHSQNSNLISLGEGYREDAVLTTDGLDSNLASLSTH